MRLWDRLRGFEHLKHRADRFYLAGEFEAAKRHYARARSTLPLGDHRAQALEALILSCDRLAGSLGASRLTGSEPVTQVGQDEEVLPDLTDLFELAIAEKPPSRAVAYRLLGESFRAGYVALLQGTPGRAVQKLERAAEETPSSFVVHLELGRALSLDGRLEEARRALLVAERLSPGDEEGTLLLAAVDIELRRYQEAAQRLRRLVDSGRRDPEVTFLLGKALAGEGRREAALEKFRETVKLEPRFHEAFFEAGRLKRDASDAEAAFQLFNRAAALAPDEVTYNRELAELVLDRSLDEDAGLAACDRLMITDEERRWQYLSWIGELYIRRGWRREARDPLTKALELVPPEHKRERLEIEQRLASLSS